MTRRDDTICDLFVVDPDRKFREEVVQAVEAYGYRARAFEDPLVALSEIIEHPPRIVISELVLAGMSGIELCQAVRRHEKTASIHFICVSSLYPGSWKGRQRLAQQYEATLLQKPFSPTDLSFMIADLLGDPTENGASRSASGAHGDADREPTIDLQGRGGIEASLRVDFDSMKELIRQVAEDLSSGRMFIPTEDRPRIDASIEVRFHAPELARPISARARVVQHLFSGPIPGVGVCFDDLNTSDRKILEEVVATVPKLIITIGTEGVGPTFLGRRGVSLLAFPSVDDLIDKADALLPYQDEILCIINGDLLGRKEPNQLLAALRTALGPRARIAVRRPRAELRRFVDELLVDSRLDYPRSGEPTS
jgi:CheY-like chemotaxis protein